MIRKDDEELLERYQHAVVARRGLRAQAKAARGEGRVDYLAEAEAVFNQGQEDAYGWLLGRQPRYSQTPPCRGFQTTTRSSPSTRQPRPRWPPESSVSITASPRWATRTT